MTIQPAHSSNAMRHRMLAASMPTAKESAAASTSTETQPSAPPSGQAPTDPVSSPGAVTDPLVEAAPVRERAHGVLRLLEAGHFRGVAALRLAAKFGVTVDPAAVRPPNGNGRAFERFMAEYQAAQPQPLAASEAAPEAAAADVVA